MLKISEIGGLGVNSKYGTSYLQFVDNTITELKQPYSTPSTDSESFRECCCQQNQYSNWQEMCELFKKSCWDKQLITQGMENATHKSENI